MKVRSIGQPFFQSLFLNLGEFCRLKLRFGAGAVVIWANVRDLIALPPSKLRYLGRTDAQTHSTLVLA